MTNGCHIIFIRKWFEYLVGSIPGTTRDGNCKCEVEARLKQLTIWGACSFNYWSTQHRSHLTSTLSHNNNFFWPTPKTNKKERVERTTHNLEFETSTTMRAIIVVYLIVIYSFVCHAACPLDTQSAWVRSVGIRLIHFTYLFINISEYINKLFH